VLREVRAVLAVKYLRDRRLKALEVAMLLGYSSISSFTTAFKSWYDLPPATYRERFLGRT
jgi:AraC-like DNA-binding protein